MKFTKAIKPLARPKYFSTFVLLFGLFLVFFYWRRFLLGTNLGAMSDWSNFYSYLIFIKETTESFRFPVFDFNGNGSIFANPEAPVGWPGNILLLFFSVFTYIKINLLLHYLLAFWGIFLIVKYFKINKILALPILIIGFMNGNFSAHFFAGHYNWITYLLFPLVYGLYLNRSRHIAYSLGMGAIASLMFYEGGQHIVLWLFIFIFINSLMIGIIEKKPLVELKYFLVFFSTFFILSFAKYVPSSELFSGYYSQKNTILPGYTSIRQLISFTILGRLRDLSGADYPWNLLWWETFTYIGILPIILLLGYLLYPIKKRSAEEWGLIVSGILFILFSYGMVWRLIAYGTHSVLLISQRHPTRFILIGVFSLSVVASLFLGRLFDQFKKKYPIWSLLCLFLIISILFITVYFKNRTARTFSTGSSEVLFEELINKKNKQVFDINSAQEDQVTIKSESNFQNHLELKIEAKKDFQLYFPQLIDRPPQIYKLISKIEGGKELTSLKDHEKNIPYFELPAGNYVIDIKNNKGINYPSMAISLAGWLSLLIYFTFVLKDIFLKKKGKENKRRSLQQNVTSGKI